MIKKSDLSRREFLKDAGLAGAGVALLGGLAPARVLGANDEIRVGVLGTGGRAQYLMKLFKKSSGANSWPSAMSMGRAARRAQDRRPGAQGLSRLPRGARPQGRGRGPHRQSGPLAQADACGRGARRQRRSISKSPSCIPSRRAWRWCAPSRRRSASSRRAPSSGAGSTGSWASRSSIPASWARSPWSTRTGTRTTCCGPQSPSGNGPTQLDWKRFLGERARPAVHAEKFHLWWRFLGFWRRDPDRSADSLD